MDLPETSKYEVLFRSFLNGESKDKKGDLRLVRVLDIFKMLQSSFCLLFMVKHRQQQTDSAKLVYLNSR